MQKHSRNKLAKYVTFLDKNRGVGFHYYQQVPNYHASQGCIRVAVYAVTKQIYENTQVNETVVVVSGTCKSPSPNPLKLQSKINVAI